MQTDSHGKTIDQARVDSRVIAERVAISKRSGHPCVLGRLWHSKRRWTWAQRFQDMKVKTFEDGSRFEPVEVVEA